MNNRARTQKKNFTPTTAGAQPQSFLCRTIETGEYVIVHRSSIKRTYDDTVEIVMNGQGKEVSIEFRGTHDECRRVWEKKNKISNLDVTQKSTKQCDLPSQRLSVDVVSKTHNNFT
ncbi:unnamed protein product [Rotaria magnacalcarata]|uniref:Uncharacterized protein n=1 Tax=Rotaria magnacalcarata TaxID=392030 RepID=A0A816CHH2_9BILA|nr:unnamed protein product [Rotaria magnacalcarata]